MYPNYSLALTDWPIGPAQFNKSTTHFWNIYASRFQADSKLLPILLFESECQVFDGKWAHRSFIMKANGIDHIIPHFALWKWMSNDWCEMGPSLINHEG